MMDSVTKSKLTEEQIVKITKQAFGENIAIKNFTELTDGYYNSAYMVELINGIKTVLKVSPSENIKIMRYEKNLMEVEVYVLNAIYALGNIPVPKVLYYDKSKSLIENEYFFMEFINGVPLNKVYETLTEEQRSKISTELGKFTRAINAISVDYFGCISEPSKRFPTWDEAFLDMISELLKDARDAKVSLPYEYSKLHSMIAAHADLLRAVKTPSLLHKDLWQGNIFIDVDTCTITGLVDCERAIYGDFLVEPACGFLLEDKTFMKNYLGRDFLTKDEHIKTILYKIYLMLMLVIECSYRHYPTNDQENWARVQLDNLLEELIKETP